MSQLGSLVNGLTKQSGAFVVVLLFALGGDAVSSENSPFSTPAAIAKLASSFCYDCHDADTTKGNIRLDNLDALSRDARLDMLGKVQEQLFINEMPPKKKDQPSSVEREQLLSWVSNELKKNNASGLEDKLRFYRYGNYINHEKLFSGEIIDKPYTPARRWRINEFIYLERVNDVFGKNNKGRINGYAGYYGITQPFNVPADSGVKYYDTEMVGGGEFLTLLANAKWIVKKQLRPALIKNGEYEYAAGFLEDLKVFMGPKKDENGNRIRRVRITSKYPDERNIIDVTPTEFERIVMNKSKPSQSDIEAAITLQFKLALQRAPTTDEMQHYVALMEDNYKVGANNSKALETILVAILMEPEFVYRSEFGDGKHDADGRVKLTPREASYAISFALTDKVPDQALAQAASSGKIISKEDYKREVIRILEDDSIDKPRLLRFFQDYFGYYNVYNVFKDESRFVGNWSPHRVFSRKYIWRVPGKVTKEADQFVLHILKEDKDVLNRLLTSDKYFVHHSGDNKEMSERAKMAAAAEKKDRDLYMSLLAKKEKKQHLNPKERKHLETYAEFFGKDGKLGIDRKTMPNDGEGTQHSIKMYNLDWRTWSYEPVQPIKIENRMGMLTHPAWLVAFSQNAHTDPVTRGKWIREKLLAGVVPDVPITVDATIEEDHHKTIRERFGKTEADKCWHCHQRMNPLGYAFEIFDDFGRYRTEEPLEHEDNIIEKRKVMERGRNGPFREWTENIYKTKQVVASGVLDGTGDKALDGDVTDAFDLVTRLSKSERVRQSFIRNVFRYFMGRNEMLSDSQTLIAADKAYVESGGSFKALVVSLLTSDSFIYRKNIKD